VTSAESLKTFGTISLGTDFMREMIQFGELVIRQDGTTYIDRELAPSSLCLALWLAFVPEPFRELATYHMSNIARRYLNAVATQKTIDQMIAEFQSKVDSECEARKLDRQGWKAQNWGDI